MRFKEIISEEVIKADVDWQQWKTVSWPKKLNQFYSSQLKLYIMAFISINKTPRRNITCSIKLKNSLQANQ
jgi:hypothetical protein